MTNKELWHQVRREFIDDLGREPTDEEMHSAFTAALGDLIEAAENRMIMDRDEA